MVTDESDSADKDVYVDCYIMDTTSANLDMVTFDSQVTVNETTLRVSKDVLQRMGPGWLVFG